jgi:uncharacterized protein YkwD
VITLLASLAPAVAGRPALAVAQPATAAAVGASDLTLAGAEASLVASINSDRAAVGLVALRVDARLSAIARERSDAMAAAGQLSHVQPDGQTALDLIKVQGIIWYGFGETIGWNNYPSLRDSSAVVNQGWLASAEHAAIIRSADYNYLGVALAATSGGDRYWTAIFLRGPDRTAPWAEMLPPAPGPYATLAPGRRVRLVTWSWSGDDIPLAALTSGLRSFEVQRRVDGGAWISIWTSTGRRSWATYVPVGHTISIRVRARDNAGNVGSWSSPVGLTA